jgi:hypothetical protein
MGTKMPDKRIRDDGWKANAPAYALATQQREFLKKMGEDAPEYDDDKARDRDAGVGGRVRRTLVARAADRRGRGRTCFFSICATV